MKSPSLRILEEIAKHNIRGVQAKTISVKTGIALTIVQKYLSKYTRSNVLETIVKYRFKYATQVTYSTKSLPKPAFPLPKRWPVKKK